jgi:hypothetical protein
VETELENLLVVVEAIELYRDLHEVFNANTLESRLILDARDPDLVKP